MILNINSRGFLMSEGIRNAIQDSVIKLEKVFPRIHACHYTVEIPHKHSHKAARFSARLDMSVPGKEIVIKSQLENNMYLAIQNVSDTAREKLLKYAAIKRGGIKAHSKSKPPIEEKAETLFEI